jgi:dihydropteroate synthase
LIRRPSFSIALPSGRVLDLGGRTLVMAIVNVTPDSFADGGVRFDPGVASADAERFVSEGADLIDIGGESTRPGAPPLPADEEWRRIGPVIAEVRKRVSVPISVDTYKAEIARKAIALGVDVLNDVSAFAYEPALADVVASSGVAVILMHNRGRSADMYERAQYADAAAEVTTELAARLDFARERGIDAGRVLVDPGLGFAKRAEHSLAALAGLPQLATLGRPIVVGPSRKSFLKAALGDVGSDQRVWGTAAAVTAAVLLGAHIVRVHDVMEMTQVVRVADAIAGQRAEGKGQRP